MHQHKLPDVLAPNLRLIFVGTAAGRRSAEVGAYYAHPGNRFWLTLHEIGLTPRRYQPHEFRDLLTLGIGFTDMSKLGSGMDHEIAADQFDVSRFVETIRHYRPRAIAFTSKRAAAVWLGKSTTSEIAFGRQQARPADFPEVFVLPSPSGAAGATWIIGPWRDLAEWLRSTPHT